MPDEFISFGRADRFEIALRGRRQRDTVDRRPVGHGWSLGDLRITVAGRVLTENVHNGHRRDHTTWYLLPIFEWLAANWVDLLHEEEFAWRETSTLAAASIVPRVMAETMGKDDAPAATRYEAAQGWRARHGLRTASTGGLLPDLYLRRFLDVIELSWTDAPVLFAPDGFRFVPRPGYASCSVDEVATPLWDAMDEFVSGVAGYPTLADDITRFAMLGRSLQEIRGLTVVDFAKARIAPGVMDVVLDYVGDRLPTLFESQRVSGSVPAIAAFSPAIAMYGGMSPELGAPDVRTLSQVALDAGGRGETPMLAALVRDAGGAPRNPPHIEGYRLAEDLLDDWTDPAIGTVFDVRGMIEALGIEIVEIALETDTIRGVGLAGDGMGPTIVVNTSSIFNTGEEGRRFTLAHELCHILYDRGHARRVGITSGPWAPAAVERRANAFAAGILMPRERVIEAFLTGDYTNDAAVVEAADRLQVSRRALTEHLYNMHLIDEVEREALRATSAH